MTVSGTVTDEATGETLPGVNIAIVGTTTGTSTDSQGQYEIMVPSPNDTLRFSFVGYQTRVVPVQGRAMVNVVMTPVTISGSQLVVVGYSTQKKQDLTGSVSVVDLESMNAQPDAQVANQLQGQASGVSVISSGQPGEEPAIRIRGINTFGNNEPLYVVDGVPTQNINDLNSNDIASM
ncbi:MAG TPA: carboxypeptidase-like regulatory domain-containing protein, partial [Halalkalibaculum sp.]|nr:carboxypeptidase-like regulatory domain-containing protein [Halalkalibaculum sp.]